MRVYVIKHPEIPQELDKAKDMMAGGVCIVDNRSVMVIIGMGKRMQLHCFQNLKDSSASFYGITT